MVQGKRLEFPRIFVCLRCGKPWTSWQEAPKYCGNCKSAYWNKPKRIFRKAAPSK